jgi:hypothetical protein
MDQSLSCGSLEPLRMTLTVISSFRESSNMREIIACADFSRPLLIVLSHRLSLDFTKLSTTVSSALTVPRARGRQRWLV